MKSKHIFHVSQVTPQLQTEGGFRVSVTKENFPELKGMSFYKLLLKPNAVREPHWHANADEFGYCLQGKVFISFFGTYNERQSFVVEKGDCFLIPSGSLHAIVNISDEEAILAFQFSNEQPEDFGLSGSTGMFTNAVLGNTWGVNQSFLKDWKRSTKDTYISLLKKPFQVPETDNDNSPYHYALESSPVTINNKCGVLHVARQDVWPILKRQSLYSLKLTNKGMREPHWHPETAEMGYITSGLGRMSIMSPGGDVDTYIIKEGDLYFIPKAYPHHIENVASEDLEILVFFDQPFPEDIGFSASVKSFADDVLMTTLKIPRDIVKELPTFENDLLIVERINPVDPI